MSRNKKQRQSVGRTPRKGSHTPKVTKPKLVIDLRGRKQRKQLTKNRELIRKQILGNRRRTSNNNSKLQILYPPIPPPPAPERVTSSKTSQRQKSSQQRPQRKFDTITVIDSEDEGVGTSASQDAIPSFYEDRTGGFDDKDVPLYVSHNDDVQLLEETLEEGEIPDDEDDLNRAIVNVERMPVQEDEDDDDVIQVDDSTVIEPTVPMPKNEDQSVIFCSEVIDLSRAVDRNKLLDFIPIGYDPDPAEARQRSPRKRSKKHREDKQAEQPEAAQKNPPHAKDVVRTAKRMVVIDGNNVAYGHSVGKEFSVKGLDICIQHFKQMGHNVKAVVPQFRQKKDKSTDQKRLDELYKAGDVLLAPSKSIPGQYSSSYDDRLILSVAEKFDGVVISNDNFRDLLQTDNESWKKIIKTRVIGYTWVMDEFFLPDDPYGRHGPKLKDLLESKQQK
uniref:NEDD4-binding protein 1 n=1 Tax=Culex pipiens TaxID=7175 RepID=A0A8D8C2K1_CULPI